MKKFLIFAQRFLYQAYPGVFSMTFITIIMYDWAFLRQLEGWRAAILFSGVAAGALLPMLLPLRVSKLAERLLKTQYGVSCPKRIAVVPMLVVLSGTIILSIVPRIESKGKKWTQRQCAGLVLAVVVSAGLLTWWVLRTFVVVYWIFCAITVSLYLTCLALMAGTVCCTLLRAVLPAAEASSFYAYDLNTDEKIEVEFVEPRKR